MKILNWIKKILIFIGFIVLMVVPILLILKMSNGEIADLNQDKYYDFNEKTYGVIYKLTRENLKENFDIDGVVKSIDYQDVEIPSWLGENVTYNIKQGDEISKGDVLAFCNGKSIISEYDGIVVDIQLYDKRIIKINTFDDIVLECLLERDVADRLKSSKKLTTNSGQSVKVLKISKIMEDNKIKMILKVSKNNFVYNQHVEGLKIYTGTKYNNVLVAPEYCVFKKNKDYYIREVDKDGNFIRDRKVKIGFIINGKYSIVGIKDVIYCDSGYKSIFEKHQEIDGGYDDLEINNDKNSEIDND